MGMIQSAVNSALSGTAYLLKMGQIAGKTEQPAAPQRSEKDIVSDHMRELQKKSVAARKAKAEAAMKESLQAKAEQKQNGAEVAKRLKGQPAGFYTNEEINKMGGKKYGIEASKP